MYYCKCCGIYLKDKRSIDTDKSKEDITLSKIFNEPKTKALLFKMEKLRKLFINLESLYDTTFLKGLHLEEMTHYFIQNLKYLVDISKFKYDKSELLIFFTDNLFPIFKVLFKDSHLSHDIKQLLTFIDSKSKTSNIDHDAGLGDFIKGIGTGITKFYTDKVEPKLPDVVKETKDKAIQKYKKTFEPNFKQTESALELYSSRLQEISAVIQSISDILIADKDFIAGYTKLNTRIKGLDVSSRDFRRVKGLFSYVESKLLEFKKLIVAKKLPIKLQYRAKNIEESIKVKKAFKFSSKYDINELKDDWTGNFVIQDHKASTHHFDLRLEFPKKGGSTYRSWAVPKATLPALGKNVFIKETEDHDEDSAKFEGEIEKGYGKGKVKIHDRGTWELLRFDYDKKYVFWLNGHKVKGKYALIKTTGEYDGFFLVKMKNQNKAEK